FHLRQEVDDVFGAAIELGMSLLPTETLGFRDGNALQSDFLERFLHLVELERLDDGFDLLHLAPPGHCRSNERTGRSRKARRFCACPRCRALSGCRAAVRCTDRGLHARRTRVASSKAGSMPSC